MSSKSAKNSKQPSKKDNTAKPTSQSPVLALPKTIKLKKDHLKILNTISNNEKSALDMIAQAYLRIRQLERRQAKLEQEKRALDQELTTQKEKIEREVISPQEQEVQRQRKQLIEMGQSFMEFYDLPQREGLTWQLTIDEGAWILVPIDPIQ